ncbi:hypothetical protein GCM10023340_38130 [Nocardioides marinquilinus]|uniref:Peptidase MA-like domain-containing protein n=1 Tax=Nocardioides marinquilinus TaxID=1210400 RepID=A0ABP9Q000_9ACTN
MLRCGRPVLAVLLAVVLAGCGDDEPLDGPDEPSASASSPASTAPASSSEPSSSGDEPFSAEEADFAAVERLLDRRAAAVLDGDRAAFLATVDRGNPALRREQRVLFENLRRLPVASLRYAVSRDGYRPDEVAGDDPVLRPRVAEHLALRGVWRRPVGNQLAMTFVRRDGTWRVGAEVLDETFEPQERPWFGVPLDVAVDGSVVALTDRDGPLPASEVLDGVRTELASLGELLDERGGRLLVDATSNGLPHGVREGSGDDAAAVSFDVYATDDLADSYTARAGAAIKLNPDLVDAIVEDRYTMRHELTHFLLATDTSAPYWATEGIAEYAAYHPNRLADFRFDEGVLAELDERPVGLTPAGRWGEEAAGDYLLAEATVEHLVDTYGLDRFRRMLRVFERRGGRGVLYGEGIVDEVLRDVYGEGERSVARAAYARLGLD